MQPNRSLISEVKERIQLYHDNKEEINANRDQKRQLHEQRLEENRQKGKSELIEYLKGVIPEKIKQYASINRKEARILEFTFGQELKYSNCYAKDLLTKSDVIQVLQKWLDDEHPSDDETKTRAFYIYFNMVGHQQKDRTATKYAVFVNWDPSSWNDIHDRIYNRTFIKTRESNVTKSKNQSYKQIQTTKNVKNPKSQQIYSKSNKSAKKL